MKKCSRCKIKKSRMQFSNNKNTKDGLHSWCKMCHAQYYTLHQQQRLSYSRGYKQAHKEATAEYYQSHRDEFAKYYQVHKKANAEKRKQYYQAHQDEIRAYKKQFYQTHQGKMIQNKRQYNRTHKKIILGKHYKRRYGLSYEDVNTMLKKQKNKCLICAHQIILGTKRQDKEKGVVVDHDHATNHVRGLLCNNCNYLLGNAKDSVALLLKAIAYLQKYQNSP